MAANTTYPKPQHTDDLTIETIMGTVSHYFRVATEDLPSEKRSAHLLNARKAIVYLSKRLLLLNSLKAAEANSEVREQLVASRGCEKSITYELAMALNRDHATIEYYDSCALELREKSERFRNLTDRIWDELTDAYELDLGH